MIDRYKAVKEQIEDGERITKVMLDEDFIPPHKSAAFTPYDCVVCYTPIHEKAVFSGEDQFTESQVSENMEKLLEGTKYDRIVGVTENETSEPGDYLVYISLETFEEYKSRW